MKTSTTIKHVSVLTVLFLFLTSSSTFITKKSEIPGQKDPVKMVYNMPQGKSISYGVTTSVSQTMDIEGQSMNVLVDNNLAFKMKMVGKEAGNLKLEITIDSLSMKIDSPMGASSASKIKEVEGKTFNILISQIGKEIDVTEAARVEFSAEGSGASNFSQSFASIFPDLPENPVKPGDTWIKNDSVINKTSMSKTSTIFQSTNKFEGTEMIDGIECAKITSSMTGKMETNVQNQGMDIYYSGPYQGTVTLYFAVKEGYFVKQESRTRMTGTIEISGPQSMSFPVVMDTTSKIEAKK